MDNYRSLGIIVFLLGAGVSAGPGLGGDSPSHPPPSANKVIREMELVRENIHDLVAVVERVTINPADGKELKWEICLSYKSPDKLRSEIKGSAERVVVINGERMWIYSPRLELVEEYRLNDEKKRREALFQMSWGLTSPIKSLVRGMNRSVSSLEDGSLLVELVPDRKDAEIRKIIARVNPADWLITEMEIFPAGQPPIRLRVKEWRLNPGLAESDFDFRPPPGTDIFEPLEKSWEGGF